MYNVATVLLEFLALSVTLHEQQMKYVTSLKC
jgi:hypothetical protein